MRQILRWEFLLVKCFFRKKSFLFLYLLLSLLGLFLRLRSHGESGILRIGLATEEKEGQQPEVSRRVADRLLTGDTVLRIERVADERRAREQLHNDRLDAAWILPSDLEARIEKCADGKNILPVMVLEREDSAVMLLSREVLYRVLYPEISEPVYRRFLMEKFSLHPDGPTVRQELDARYADVKIGDELISHENTAGQTVRRQSCLHSPLRGFGALQLLLMSFVALLYLLDDRRKGLFPFASVAAERRFAPRYLLAVQAMASLGLLALLFVGELMQSAGREVLSLLCLNLLVLLFVPVIGTLTRGWQEILLVLLLPLLFLCLLGALVFLDLGIRALELVNPLYYYFKPAAGTLAPVVEL